MTLRKEIEKIIANINVGNLQDGDIALHNVSDAGKPTDQICQLVKERLERIKLEFDVNICECGEKWKETDCAILVDNLITELS